MDGDGLEQAAQTAAEHGAAAAAAAGGGPARAKASRPAVLSPDTPDGVCANCEAGLQGPVCHQCGQVADEYHRPVHGLLGEVFEGLTALDGRVVRTLPALLLRPGRLTRAFLKGKRARYMPPFRLYIIASLMFFLLAPGFHNLAEAVRNNAGLTPGDRAAAVEEVEAELREQTEAGTLSDAEAERIREVIAAMSGVGGSGEPQPDGEDASDPARAPPEEPGETATGEEIVSPPIPGVEDFGLSSPVVINGASDPDSIRRFFTPEDFGEPAPDTIWPLPIRRHLGARFAEVAADPGGWLDAVAAWVPRIMFVMVPVYALLLALVYAWRRGFYLFDHLIVSLHFHAALFLTMAILMLASNLIGAGLAWLILLIYSNVYLYRVHRVVYGRGRVTSVLRALTLDLLYFFVLTLGFVAVLLLGALV